MSATAAIHTPLLQAVHEEQLCRGEEPHYCQLPTEGSGNERLYVIVLSIGDNWLTSFSVVELPEGPSQVPTTYNLLANMTHESVASITRDKTDTAWKVVLRAPPLPSSFNTEQAGIEGEERWIGIQDLIVEDIRKEMIFLGETVLQVWERKDLAEAQSGRKQATSRDQRMDVDS